MSPREPRIVAELGRPETPEETAARKAASSRAHREKQTFFNLIIAVIATVLAAGVLFVIVFPNSPPPPEPVDVQTEAAAASEQMQAELLAPEVPEDWWSNAAQIRRGSDDVITWYVGYVTPDEGFAALTQAFDANPTWVQQTIRDAIPTGETTIDGIDWTVYDQRGISGVGNLEFIMVTEHGESTVIVFGTANAEDFDTFAQAVSENLQTLPATD